MVSGFMFSLPLDTLPSGLNIFRVENNDVVMGDTTWPMLLAAIGAILFGASAPVSKALLGEIGPVTLAGLLYLGSGAGLGALLIVRKLRGHRDERLSLKREDLPWLAGSVVAGGIAAPVALLWGLSATSAATGSLLLNFECVATSVIAFAFFREHIGKRILLAIGAITVASIVLSLGGEGGLSLSPGALGVLGSCVLWGIDNNLTRKISSKDPVAIGTIKGLAAGTVNLSIGVLITGATPAAGASLSAMALGCVSYGLSIMFFIVAMRGLGAARTSAWFGIAPFAGALLSFVLLHESPDIRFFIALPLMIAGAVLLFGEEHRHVHSHVAVEHEHTHFPGDVEHSHSHDERP